MRFAFIMFFQNFACVVFFIQCTHDLEIDLPSSTPKLVIESYITGGDSLWVRVDESVHYYSSSNTTERGRNAIVEIQHAGKIFRLKEHSGEVWLDSQTRLFRPTFYYLPKDSFVVPNTGTFALEVRKTGYTTVYATSTMLPSVDLVDFRFFYGSDSISVASAEASAFFPSGRTWYAIQGRQKLFRNDTLFLDFIVAHEIVEVNGNGSLQTITIRGKNSGIRAGAGSRVVNIMRLMRISKEYYDFYQAVKRQQNNNPVDAGHLLAGDGIEVPSNIKNGLGLFTVLAVDTMMKTIR